MRSAERKRKEKEREKGASRRDLELRTHEVVRSDVAECETYVHVVEGSIPKILEGR